MKLACLVIHCTLLLFAYTASAQKLAEPILLWPNGVPGATGVRDEDKPAVIAFVAEASTRSGAAVLVVPGGGFTIRAVDHEGVGGPVAERAWYYSLFITLPVAASLRS